MQAVDVQFWKPLQDLKMMEMTDLGNMKPTNFLEYVLMSQVMERKVECTNLVKQCMDCTTLKALGDECNWLVEDMPGMVKDWQSALKGSGSAVVNSAAVG